MIKFAISAWNFEREKGCCEAIEKKVTNEFEEVKQKKKKKSSLRKRMCLS